MSMSVRNLILIFLAFFCISVSAQDIHFSQFFNSPLTLNPSLTGDIDGNIRAVINHRNQWNTVPLPFVTSSVSCDARLLEDMLKGDVLGAGIMIFDDKAGINNASRLQVMTSFSYLKKLDPKQNKVLSFGVQLGFFQRSISSLNLKFPNQFNYDDFYTSISNGESFSGYKASCFDFQTGVAFIMKKPKKYKANIGVSLFHVNRPNESFLGQDYRLPVRTVIHAGVRYNLGNGNYFCPDIIIMSHNKASEKNLFCRFQHNMQAKNINYDLIFGLGFRAKDALIALAGIGYDKWEFNFSYDINNSDFHNASNYKGGFEISIIYKDWLFSGKEDLPFVLPCQRY